MAWDFETEDEFAEQLRWMREFIDSQLIPLEPIYDRLPRDQFGQRPPCLQTSGRIVIAGD